MDEYIIKDLRNEFQPGDTMLSVAKRIADMTDEEFVLWKLGI